MLGRFTDSARAVLREAFRRTTIASERDILSAILAVPHGLGNRLLATAGIEAGRLADAGVVFDRPTLVARAAEEARRCGVDHVGTEHILLALARSARSSLARLADPDHIEDLRSTAVADWRRAHPSLLHRLGSSWRRLRGHGA